MKIEVTYRSFLYIRRRPSEGQSLIVDTISNDRDEKKPELPPELPYYCKFVRWLDDDWKTESVEVSDES